MCLVHKNEELERRKTKKIGRKNFLEASRTKLEAINNLDGHP